MDKDGKLDWRAITQGHSSPLIAALGLGGSTSLQGIPGLVQNTGIVQQGLEVPEKLQAGLDQIGEVKQPNAVEQAPTDAGSAFTPADDSLDAIMASFAAAPSPALGEPKRPQTQAQALQSQMNAIAEKRRAKPSY